MSKGSRIIGVRVPKELEVQVEESVKNSKTYRFKGPHTLSSWIIAAIEEKLAHQRRSNRKKRTVKQLTNG
jgi:hypothetical protein